MIHSIAIVAVVALCTFATRIAAFALFGRSRTVAPVVRYLGDVLDRKSVV